MRELNSTGLWATADLRGYKKDKNIFYLLKFWRAFPSEDPIATPHLKTSARGQSILWRGLRPELVRSNPVPLSPDANLLVTHNAPDWRQQRDDVLEATRRLVNEVCSSVGRRVSQGASRFTGSKASLKAILYLLRKQGFARRNHHIFWTNIPTCTKSVDFPREQLIGHTLYATSFPNHLLHGCFNGRLSRNLQRNYVERIWGAQMKYLVMASILQRTCIAGVLVCGTWGYCVTCFGDPYMEPSTCRSIPTASAPRQICGYNSAGGTRSVMIWGLRPRITRIQNIGWVFRIVRERTRKTSNRCDSCPNGCYM